MPSKANEIMTNFNKANKKRRQNVKSQMSSNTSRPFQSEDALSERTNDRTSVLWAWHKHSKANIARKQKEENLLRVQGQQQKTNSVH